MNVLLDTCALLALSRGDLPGSSRGALRVAPEAWVSAVSAWEVAIKVASGKLRLPRPPAEWFGALVVRHRLREIPIDSPTACSAAALPAIHQDPFDRILVSLAQARTLVILSSDRILPKYPGIQTLW